MTTINSIALARVVENMPRDKVRAIYFAAADYKTTPESLVEKFGLTIEQATLIVDSFRQVSKYDGTRGMRP